MPEYAQDTDTEAFAQARDCYGQVERWLGGAGAAALTHAGLEDELGTRGRELLRLLFQGALDLRALREERRDDVTADDVPRTRVERGHARPLVTVFGDTRVTRMAYRAPGQRNAYLADAKLSLPQEKHSHGVRRLAAAEAARGSYEEAAAAITGVTGIRIGKRQAEQLAVRAAADVAAFYDQRRPAPAPREQLVVLTSDGKGVVMRPDGLRPATAKAAARSGQKLAARLSPGEKNGRKRMAELACVYDCVPVRREPGDIITPPGQARPARPAGRPEAAGKWLTASLTSDIAAVIATAFDEAERRDPQHARTWIALLDGNNTQIEAVQAGAARRGITITIVVDFIHVLEYVWKAAWSFFEPGDPDAEHWVADQARKILDGKAAQVAAGIRRRATTYGFQGKERDGADACAAYLTAKKPYLDYATALASGWPIATGVIEGACRHLVKDRMDITGARWGLTGAEAILKLRAVRTNRDFDDYWAYHLRKEHERIHASRYALAA